VADKSIAVDHLGQIFLTSHDGNEKKNGGIFCQSAGYNLQSFTGV
jgi:hypothetical protein